jgi:dihydrofolate synthase / folylpolyglutamate synthase
LERREFLGWKLGLERMRRLCSLLGMPQNRFASIHVVGTNGKTSVARMTAALLGEQGVRAGAYLSPHIDSWAERIEIGGEPISDAAFAQAIERAEESAQVADRSAGEEGPVTQYELLTAAAFVAFAAARVQVAVIEAGLGGRLDATNVIPSKLTVLTSVGLDHTEWLGDTLEQIAGEKLAVLRDHTTLVTPDLPAEVEEVAARAAEERHADRVRVEADQPEAGLGPTNLPAWGYPERNLALAAAAASEFLGKRLEPETVSAAAGHLSNPGRAEVIEGDPRVILDAAHNEQGALALARLLPALSGGREVVGCIAVLEDKDAEGIVRALARPCARIVFTEVPAELMAGTGRPGARSREAAQLAEIAREAGREAEVIPDPDAAWRRARDLARELGGVALAAGSHYLLTCLWTERRAESS